MSQQLMIQSGGIHVGLDWGEEGHQESITGELKDPQ